MRHFLSVRRSAVVMAMVTLACAVAVLLWWAAGRSVIAAEAARAEIVVVHTGASLPVILAARDLYLTGGVRGIVIIPQPRFPPRVERELIALGLLDRTLPSTNERVLLASGVPPSAIHLTAPADEAHDTIQAGREVARYIRDRGNPTVVVLTMKLSAHRVCAVFRGLVRDAKVTCAVTRYDPFDLPTAWKRPRDLLDVVMESQRFFVDRLQVSLEWARVGP